MPEAVVRRCSVKKVFLETSQNSRENTCSSVSFLIKLQARSETLLKKTLAQVLSCEFCEISRTPFLTEHLWWLLLKCVVRKTFEKSKMDPINLHLAEASTDGVL